MKRKCKETVFFRPFRGESPPPKFHISLPKNRSVKVNPFDTKLNNMGQKNGLTAWYSKDSSSGSQ